MMKLFSAKNENISSRKGPILHKQKGNPHLKASAFYNFFFYFILHFYSSIHPFHPSTITTIFSQSQWLKTTCAFFARTLPKIRIDEPILNLILRLTWKPTWATAPCIDHIPSNKNSHSSVGVPQMGLLCLSHSFTNISFLDASISSQQERHNNISVFRLTTGLYTKPLGTYQYIHCRSAHPKAMKRAIIKGEMNRRIRILLFL
jgi:hypothetical protein